MPVQVVETPDDDPIDVNGREPQARRGEKLRPAWGVWGIPRRSIGGELYLLSSC